jgi:hypothetical protein
MITLTREETQQVLDALEYHVAQTRPITRTQETIETLRARLAQPEPEPVAYLVLFEGAGKLLEFTKGNYLHGAKVEHIPLYTAPPQREWRGLTDEEIKQIVGGWGSLPIDGYTRKLFDQIEAKLKEKNT